MWRRGLLSPSSVIGSLCDFTRGQMSRPVLVGARKRSAAFSSPFPEVFTDTLDGRKVNHRSMWHAWAARRHHHSQIGFESRRRSVTHSIDLIGL